MKNKEIEDILNELQRRKQRYDYCKNNDISFSDEDYKSYLLLSYIEQLQQDYDFLNEKYDSTIKYNEKLIQYNEEYKLRIDKAIEYLNQPYRDNFDYSKAKLINILESDEQ